MTHQITNKSGQDPWDDLIHGLVEHGNNCRSKKCPPPRPPPPKVAPHMSKSVSGLLRSKDKRTNDPPRQFDSKRNTNYLKHSATLPEPITTEDSLINFHEPFESPTAESGSDGQSINSVGSESNTSNYSSGFDDNFDPFTPIPEMAKTCGNSSFYNTLAPTSKKNLNDAKVSTSFVAPIKNEPPPLSVAQNLTLTAPVKKANLTNSALKECSSTFYSTKEENTKNARATIIRPKASSSTSHSYSLPTLAYGKPVIQSHVPESIPPLPPRPLEKKDCNDSPFAISIHQFEGTEDGDLSFKENQIVQLLYSVNDEWLYGRSGFSEGIFPKSFVDIKVNLKEKEVREKSPSVSFSCEQKRDANEVTALYCFQAEMPGDLSIQEGDKIEVQSILSEDWLYGSCRGNSGQFPSSFVNRVPPNLPRSNNAQ